MSLSTVLSNNDLYTVSKGLVLALIMLSLVLLTGYGGQISLCQLTFVGVGAFTMGKVAAGGSPLGLVAAFVVTALIGAMVALPALRLRGLYLALATFAFAQAMTAAFFNNNNVFGQGGALKVARVELFGLTLHGKRAFFLFIAGVFALAAVAVLAMRRASFGRRLTAMSDSPAACATLGMSLTRTKLAVFALSAGLAGVAGALYGGLQGSVGTADFQVFQSLVLLLLAVLWGVDSVTGVLLAGLFFASFPTLQHHFPQLRNLQYLLTGLGVLGLSRNPGGVVRQVIARVDELRHRRSAQAPAEAEGAEAASLRPRPRPRPRRDDLTTPAAVPALELRGITASYGSIEVVHGVDLVVPPSSVFALLGPNGAGKSTLLKVASCHAGAHGRMRPHRGCPRERRRARRRRPPRRVHHPRGPRHLRQPDRESRTYG